MLRIIITGLCMLCAAPTWAGDVIAGPVRAEVLKVQDGDSIKVRAHPWVGLSVDVWVRLRGVDAPELRGACSDEKRMARQAREVVRFIEETTVLLRRVGPDKYGQRVVADIEAAGIDLGAMLIEQHLGRPYSGGRRVSWCE